MTIALYDCDGNKSFAMKQLQKEYIGSVDIDLAAEIAANEQTEKWYTITWNPKLRIRGGIGRSQVELKGKTFGDLGIWRLVTPQKLFGRNTEYWIARSRRDSPALGRRWFLGPWVSDRSSDKNSRFNQNHRSPLQLFRDFLRQS